MGSGQVSTAGFHPQSEPQGSIPSLRTQVVKLSSWDLPSGQKCFPLPHIYFTFVETWTSLPAFPLAPLATVLFPLVFFFISILAKSLRQLLLPYRGWQTTIKTLCFSPLTTAEALALYLH